MSRHQVRLLLCSIASVALIAGALFALEWFRVDFGPAQITIDLREMHMCAPSEACKTIDLASMQGLYPVSAIAAFWGALALGLLVIGQCFARVLAGSASVSASRLGYVLASAVFLCAFGAGYLFAPETDGMLGMMGATVNQTFAPPMLLAGCLFALLALRYAQLDAVVDEAGEYKPVVLKKDLDARLPVTPIQTKQIEPAPRERRPTPASFERIPLPGRTPTGERVASGRTPTGERVAPATTRDRVTDTPPLASKRPGTDSERTKAPSQQPAARERAKTASDSPTGTGTSVGAPRTKTASQQQPMIARTVSPNEPVIARTKSPSREPDDGPTEVDPMTRARTSSSGPIDLAARLSGAPIAVAIKPPLPEPVPVPPDQIPVAPESGLVIRKRTPSSGPLTAKAAQAAAALVPAAPRTKTPTGTKPLSAIGRRITDDFDVATPIPAAMPMHEEDMTGLGLSFEAEPARVSSVAATGSSPPGKLQPVSRDSAAPPGLRGKLNYAVTSATLSSTGIEAMREDGSTRQVTWEAIVGIIARRLPNEAPFDGSTFVDLVSTAGSTLRILEWSQLAGAPIHGSGEERARAFVQLVAARCLDAKLDSWTKVFADGVGRAAQLPSAKTLSAHDDRLA
ncbi:MAG TPA: hypothetical protein VFV99_14885 [Kofleriaceae bacterium]|nr:hypothetical protein [Kofleriaceae bacterium]